MRIIAASNRPLDRLVAQGAFREDLYYRVRVFPIRIPPLRERPEDIDPLVDWFLVHLPRELKKKPVELAPDGARERLRAYDWPGNVRELRNCLERAIILSEDGRIEREAPAPVAGPAAGAAPGGGDARGRAGAGGAHRRAGLARAGARARPRRPHRGRRGPGPDAPQARGEAARARAGRE